MHIHRKSGCPNMELQVKTSDIRDGWRFSGIFGLTTFRLRKKAEGVKPNLDEIGTNDTRVGLVQLGSETNKFGLGGNEQRLCPKTRRLGPAIPEFLKPLRCSKHSAEGRSGVLNLIADEKIDGRESACTGCSPSLYAGSPPGRTGNPLVRDVQFIHQLELLSPFTRTKLSNKFGITSAPPV
ncbi:hypothetical protein CRYUN_Cryun24cG0004800 [Craigia yunnanensis]